MAQETEAKFYITQPSEMPRQIERLGGIVSGARVHELNLRFDKPGGDLRRLGQVLRLRRDRLVRLTYKGIGRASDGAISRLELEISVNEFDEARGLLEALGYIVVFIYEKYRTTYKLNDVELMLDEMPYGNFIEIEGRAAALKPTAEKLKLNWEAAIPRSYSALFEGLSARRGLVFRDLTFENFKGLQIAAPDLDVSPADTQTG